MSLKEPTISATTCDSTIEIGLPSPPVSVKTTPLLSFANSADITPRLTDYTIHPTLEAMALNIKNPRVERLAAEVAKLARESKTEAIGRALEERKARLASRVIRRDRRTEFLAFLQREIWPKVPRKHRRRRLTRMEEDALLGYGPEGV